ncbi:MAG: paraquat-inducible protein A [Verrucomicrobia bacterium]|nr:paraquat-inducible protein A [Verrucomicrobiota bacterium]MBU1733793.1 paraquat-inducible protein A [Verrucomicrobiota bacterium]MBU1856742.1 paraquat-inducible protein A [Verrucomicrobiota bacterium]
MQNEDNKTATLYERAGRSQVVIPIMLVLAALFNVAALMAPFYKAKLFLNPPYTFTLPNSVWMMWEQHFFFIALLIFSFSIVFPLLKLTTLFYIWFFCRNANKMERLITIVGPLGKWSMLDIFVTIILMVLTNDRFLITSSLKIGVYFFLAAIFLSMTCALRMETLVFAQGIKSRVRKMLFIQRMGNVSCVRRIAIFILLVLSLTALVLAINVPVIRTHDFFFANNEYSILSAVPALWGASKVLTYFVVFTLILCPLLHVAGLMIMWVGRLKPEFSYRIERFLHVVSIFNMLDVFCLALFVFITEGGELVLTEAKSGLFLLLIFLFGAYLIPIIIKGTHENYLQYIKQPIKTIFG